jgi:hypothetical protein
MAGCIMDDEDIRDNVIIALGEIKDIPLGVHKFVSKSGDDFTVSVTNILMNKTISITVNDFVPYFYCVNESGQLR